MTPGLSTNLSGEILLCPFAGNVNREVVHGRFPYEEIFFRFVFMSCIMHAVLTPAPVWSKLKHRRSHSSPPPPHEDTCLPSEYWKWFIYPPSIISGGNFSKKYHRSARLEFFQWNETACIIHKFRSETVGHMKCLFNHSSIFSVDDCRSREYPSCSLLVSSVKASVFAIFRGMDGVFDNLRQQAPTPLPEHSIVVCRLADLQAEHGTQFTFLSGRKRIVRFYWLVIHQSQLHFRVWKVG